jgi:hypothetical protein
MMTVILETVNHHFVTYRYLQLRELPSEFHAPLLPAEEME